jgi:hypothetical protein
MGNYRGTGAALFTLPRWATLLLTVGGSAMVVLTAVDWHNDRDFRRQPAMVAKSLYDDLDSRFRDLSDKYANEAARAGEPPGGPTAPLSLVAGYRVGKRGNLEVTLAEEPVRKMVGYSLAVACRGDDPGLAFDQDRNVAFSKWFDSQTVSVIDLETTEGLQQGLDEAGSLDCRIARMRTKETLDPTLPSHRVEFKEVFRLNARPK